MWRCGGETGPTCQTGKRTMDLKHNLLLVRRSRLVFSSLWEMSSQCWPGPAWPGPAWGGPFPATRAWLRRFLLLKLVTVLLLPQGGGLPLLVGCMFSLRALRLLAPPHVSTKPSPVLLAQLARSDGLVLLTWGLRLGAALGGWGGDTVGLICDQLLDAHHLASLLILGLLGLEAMLVVRWPHQTRAFRTSHVALLSCRLVWILVLLELTSSLHLKLLQDFRQQVDLSTLPTLSVYSRRMLWLMDSWLHYAIFIRKPLKRHSSFH